jgi:hypothetical protein
MSAPNDDALTLLGAVDTLQKVRDLLQALAMSAEGMVSSGREQRSAIVYLAHLALTRLDKAERKIDLVRTRLKPTQAAS